MRAFLSTLRWPAWGRLAPVVMAVLLSVTIPVLLAARAAGHPVIAQWAAAYSRPSSAVPYLGPQLVAQAGVSGSSVLLQQGDDPSGLNALRESEGRQFTDPLPATMDGTPIEKGSVLHRLYTATDPIVISSAFFPLRKLVEQMSVWLIFPLVVLSILVGISRGSPDQELVMGAKRLLVVLALLWAYPLWDILLVRGIAFPVARVLMSPNLRDVFLVKEAQRRGLAGGPGTAEAKRDTLRMFLYGRNVALDSAVRANPNLTAGVPDSLKPSHVGMMSSYYTNDLSCAVRLGGEGLGGDPVLKSDSTTPPRAIGAPTARKPIVRDPRTVTINDMGALQPNFRQKVNQLVLVMERRGYKIRPTETLRIQSRQEYLYAQGRTRPGNIVTWTLNSNHRSGFAVDFIINGSYNPQPYREMRQVAAVIPGLGWLPGENDLPHIEMPRAYRPQITVQGNQVTSNKRTPGTAVQTTGGNAAVVAAGDDKVSGAAQSVEEAGLYRCVGDEVPGIMHGMHTVSWVGLATNQLKDNEQVVDRIQTGWKSVLSGKFAALKTFVAGAASAIETAGKWGFGIMKALITGDWSAVAEMILEAFLGIIMQLVNLLTAAILWLMWLRMIMSRVVSLTFAPFMLALGIRGSGVVPDGTRKWFKGHAEICLQPVGLAFISLIFFMMTIVIHSDRKFLGPTAQAPAAASVMVASSNGPAGSGALLAMAQPPATPTDTVVTLPQGFNPRNIDVTQIDSLRFDPQQRSLLRDIPVEPPSDIVRMPVSLRLAMAVILVFLALSADRISKALSSELGQVGKVVASSVEGRARQAAFLAARLTVETAAAVATGGTSVVRAAGAEIMKQGLKGGLKQSAKTGLQAAGRAAGSQLRGAASRGLRSMASGVMGAALGGGMVMSREDAEAQGLLGDQPTMGQVARADALSAFEQTAQQMAGAATTSAPASAPRDLAPTNSPAWDAETLLAGMEAPPPPTWGVDPQLPMLAPTTAGDMAGALAGLGGWLGARGALPKSRAESINRVLDGRLDIERVVEMLTTLPAPRQAQILGQINLTRPEGAQIPVGRGTQVEAAEWRSLLTTQGPAVLNAAPDVLGKAQWERGLGPLIEEALRAYPEWASALEGAMPNGQWQDVVEGGLLADGGQWLEAGVGRSRQIQSLGLSASDPMTQLLAAVDLPTYQALTREAGGRERIVDRTLDLVVPALARQAGVPVPAAGAAGQMDVRVLLDQLNQQVPAASPLRAQVEALVSVAGGVVGGAAMSEPVWAGIGAVAAGAYASRATRARQVVQRTAEAGALGLDVQTWRDSGGTRETYRVGATSALALTSAADPGLPIDLQFAVAQQALATVRGGAMAEGDTLQSLSPEMAEAVRAQIATNILPQAQLAAMGTTPQEVMQALGGQDLGAVGQRVAVRPGSLAEAMLGADATVGSTGAALPELVRATMASPDVRAQVQAAVAAGVPAATALLTAAGLTTPSAMTAAVAPQAAMEQLLTLTAAADASLTKAEAMATDAAPQPLAPSNGTAVIEAVPSSLTPTAPVTFERRLAEAFVLEGRTADRPIEDGAGQGARAPLMGVMAAATGVGVTMGAVGDAAPPRATTRVQEQFVLDGFEAPASQSDRRGPSAVEVRGIEPSRSADAETPAPMSPSQVPAAGAAAEWTLGAKGTDAGIEPTLDAAASQLGAGEGFAEPTGPAAGAARATTDRAGQVRGAPSTPSEGEAELAGRAPDGPAARAASTDWSFGPQVRGGDDTTLGREGAGPTPAARDAAMAETPESVERRMADTPMQRQGGGGSTPELAGEPGLSPAVSRGGADGLTATTAALFATDLVPTTTPGQTAPKDAELPATVSRDSASLRPSADAPAKSQPEAEPPRAAIADVAPGRPAAATSSIQEERRQPASRDLQEVRGGSARPAAPERMASDVTAQGPAVEAALEAFAAAGAVRPTREESSPAAAGAPSKGAPRDPGATEPALEEGHPASAASPIRAGQAIETPIAAREPDVSRTTAATRVPVERMSADALSPAPEPAASRIEAGPPTPATPGSVGAPSATRDPAVSRVEPALSIPAANAPGEAPRQTQEPAVSRVEPGSGIPAARESADAPIPTREPVVSRMAEVTLAPSAPADAPVPTREAAGSREAPASATAPAREGADAPNPTREPAVSRGAEAIPAPSAPADVPVPTREAAGSREAPASATAPAREGADAPNTMREPSAATPAASAPPTAAPARQEPPRLAEEPERRGNPEASTVRQASPSPVREDATAEEPTPSGARGVTVQGRDPDASNTRPATPMASAAGQTAEPSQGPERAADQASQLAAPAGPSSAGAGELPAPSTSTQTTPTGPQELLRLEPNFLEFQIPAGSNVALEERVRVFSPVGAQLSVGAVSYTGGGEGWLRVRGNDAMRPTALRVEAFGRDLPPGEHRAAVVLTNTQTGTPTTVVLQVLLTVVGASPDASWRDTVAPTAARLTTVLEELTSDRGLSEDMRSRVRRAVADLEMATQSVLRLGGESHTRVRATRLWELRDFLRTVDGALRAATEEAKALGTRTRLDAARQVVRALDRACEMAAS